MPYNELELQSDGTYSSTLFGSGTYRVESTSVMLDNHGTEYTLQASDDQKPTYNNICYVRTPYSIPEHFSEYGSEGIFIQISYRECSGADIEIVDTDGKATSVEDAGARALMFSGIVQDLNTYPWYDGDDVLIFGGFYADNGFVSSMAKTYTPFQITAIRYIPGPEENGVWEYKHELVVKTEDGATHDMCLAHYLTTDDRTSSVELTSDLFEGHIFRMDHYVGHKEPMIVE